MVGSQSWCPTKNHLLSLKELESANNKAMNLAVIICPRTPRGTLRILLLEEMQKYGPEPEVISLATVVDACVALLHWRRWTVKGYCMTPFTRIEGVMNIHLPAGLV